MSDPSIVVIGAGASGLMAAIWASGAAGRRVVLLEGTRDGGRKILMSGGGRCNVLPSVPAPERFVTESSPHTLRHLLRAWPLPEQVRFFEEELGLRLVLEPETGKLFPEGNRASEVRERLVSLARLRGAELRFGLRVAHLVPLGSGWRLALADGSEMAAARVVLATGGLSVPATGSDGWGFEIARRLGHTVRPTYPALTPLTAEPAVHAHLAGVSLAVTLEAPAGKRKTVARGGFLFTHKGYSGPALLDISHTAVRSLLHGGPRQEIYVRWTDLDGPSWEGRVLRHRGPMEGLIARHLPARLAETLCREAGVGPEVTGAQLRRELRLRLIGLLTRYPLPWTGDEGYTKAEVTGGGVDLAEVNPRTLESRIHPGLYFCGEVLDAFGPIGGHNFQWAWATGRSAGLAAGTAGDG
ncbi:MAG: NAD(P)/FAD-dependent oxidoreductase [Acidobacteriota bacterium]